MCSERCFITIQQSDAAAQSAGINFGIPAAAVARVRSVFWHCAISIQTEQSTPVHSWSAWMIIKADEQNMTRLNTTSTIQDTALILLLFISAHLVSLASVAYSVFKAPD